KMAKSSALLLLLALGLCEYGHRVVRFRDRSITHPKPGQRLELECETINTESGVFWVRQNKDGTLHFIVFISSLSRATFKGKKPSTHFEARKDHNIYHLVVKVFTTADEGNYFCLMNANQELYFSRGQPAFFPGQQHFHPTSLSFSKTPSTSCLCSLLTISSRGGRAEPWGLGLVLASAGDTRKLLATCPPSSPQENGKSSGTNERSPLGMTLMLRLWTSLVPTSVFAGQGKTSASPPALLNARQVPWLHQSWP
uniref:Ig-like domain-containing protein n=1 Tax=Otus sunia TaxID=257818 RepID=A0A8C8BF37_9STRI